MVSSAIVDHWLGEDPIWVKSLVSSLYRPRNSGFESRTLPLTVVVEDILQWLQLGTCDAWQKAANRTSLLKDLDHSVEVLGDALRTKISVELANLRTSMRTLKDSGNAVFAKQPQERTGPPWADAVSSARALLSALDSCTAAAASFDDLVAIAKSPDIQDRAYRPIADLLFTQIERRGYDAETTFRDLIALVSTGASYWQESSAPLAIEERLARARELASAEPDLAPTVVWLGYQGRIFTWLDTARVFFISALWAVPNAAPSGQSFAHKAELWKIVKDGDYFRVPQDADEEADVELLVRVDLGVTTPARATSRAVKILDSIFDMALGLSGGLYPQLSESVVLRAGEVYTHWQRFAPSPLNVKNDQYGVNITEELLENLVPEIADAIARRDLPLFLSAALDAQVMADKPFSRGNLMHRPSDADRANVVLLGARVVEHVAAQASMNPNELARILGDQWPHTRWLNDVSRAVQLCFSSSGLHTVDPNEELRRKLLRKWNGEDQRKYWAHFIATHSQDLLAVCRIESDRPWIRKILRSVSDHDTYLTLIERYREEGKLLESRRRRVRNALTHGNPTSPAIVHSVSEYANFLSWTALDIALESFIKNTDLIEDISRQPDDFIAMLSGEDPVSYWTKKHGSL